MYAMRSQLGEEAFRKAMAQQFFWRCTKSGIALELMLSSLLYWKTSFHPTLFAFGIVRHVFVTHRRQFTGGVFAGMSMRVSTVGDDLGVFVGQQLRCDFLDSFGRNVQGSGDMCFAVAFRREGLHDRDAFLAVELGFQLFCRDCAFHSDLLADAAFDARNYRLDSSHTISRLM
jgi:hypothetical protein